MKKPIIIATRASPLARAQSEGVAAALRAALPTREIRLHEIITKGDRIQNQPLAEIGGKGLFTAELDAALASGAAQLAAHSLKDLPTAPSGLISIILPRATPFDVLVSQYKSLDELPRGAVVGTASLRRRAQVLAARADLTIAPTRGNINTRIDKLTNPKSEDERLDALVLAGAGLARLASLKLPTGIFATPLDASIMLPAAAQGALAVQMNKDIADKDKELFAALNNLACPQTTAATIAERAALAGLDGSCRTPIAAYAHIKDDILYLEVRLLSNDGREVAATNISGAVRDAASLGQAAAAKIKQDAPHLLVFEG